MKKQFLQAGKARIPVLWADTVVVGSGCAGFNAADWLWEFGRRNILLITEGINMGTSRNTGSDKQTYYKLSLASDGEDSVAALARDLFAGEGVNGDTALAEAAGSVRSFIKLANLGVPFPTNEYGEYAGYKTDHDPRRRATSAGPLTSKYMTECLERSVLKKGVPVRNNMSAVQLLTHEGAVYGLLCLDNEGLLEAHHGLTVILAPRVILATGGPAGCYLTSVYPASQTGMSGMALEAGARGANLQEWQYGLASTKFRWNVSGTYQQVLPRYISVDENGTEREFLPDYFDSPEQALDMVFLKGYQWPFDVTKISGSSLIDLIVYRETFTLGRRVYLDFRTDPKGLETGFEGLGEETRQYLEKSGALIKTPIARLERMNPQAVSLYRGHGIDLCRDPLEIKVCAQHHNGGLAVDGNWQTSIRGLYAAGEAAGTFGVHRPGGSALNATQVGSLRAAEHIAYQTEEAAPPAPQMLQAAEAAARELLQKLDMALSKTGERSNVRAQRVETQRQMSLCAAHIRDVGMMTRMQAEILEKLRHFYEDAQLTGPKELPSLLKNRDILLTQSAVLSAMCSAAERVGSRGAALIRGEEPVGERLPELGYAPNRPLQANELVATVREAEGFRSFYQPVRELPTPDGWFETVWESYRSRRGL